MYQLLPKRLNILFLRGVLNNFDMGKKKDPGQVHSCKKSSCRTVGWKTLIYCKTLPVLALNDISQQFLKIIGLELV